MKITTRVSIGPFLCSKLWNIVHPFGEMESPGRCYWREFSHADHNCVKTNSLEILIDMIIVFNAIKQSFLFMNMKSACWIKCCNFCVLLWRRPTYKPSKGYNNNTRRFQTRIVAFWVKPCARLSRCMASRLHGKPGWQAVDQFDKTTQNVWSARIWFYWYKSMLRLVPLCWIWSYENDTGAIYTNRFGFAGSVVMAPFPSNMVCTMMQKYKFYCQINHSSH